MNKTRIAAALLALLSATPVPAEEAQEWTARSIIDKRLAPLQLPPAPIGDDSRYGIVGSLGGFSEVKQIGMSWVREEIGRVEVETLPKLLATPDWPKHPIIAEVREAGGQVLGLINFVDPKHQWARDRQESYLPQVEAFCERLVAMYKDDVKYWEVMNEPDYFWPEGTPQQVANIAIAATKGIRRADPNAFILSPCPTQPTYMEALLKYGIGPVVDGFAIHLYSTDEALLGEIRIYQELFRRFEQGKKPIWVTETGYKSAVAFGPPEKEQADWYAALQRQAQEVVKLNVQLLAAGIQRVFWYAGTDVASVYDGENFGLFWSSTHPSRGLGKQGNGWTIPATAQAVKPAGLAMHTMARMVGSLPVGGALDLGEGISAYSYGSGEASVLVIWAGKNTKIDLPTHGAGAQLTTLYGEQRQLDDAQKQMHVSIGPAPVYLKGIDVAALSVEDCRLMWPKDLQVHPGLTTPVELRLRNESESKDFQGTLSFLAPPGIQIKPTTLNVHLKSGQQETQVVQFTAARHLPIGFDSLQWRIERGEQAPALLRKRSLAVTPPVSLSAEADISDGAAQPTCVLRVENKLAIPIAGSLKVVGGDLFPESSFPLKLPPKEETVLSLPISDSKAQTPQSLTAIWTIDGGEALPVSVDFKEQPAVYRKGGITFRGNLADWRQTPSLIRLHGAKYFVAASPHGKYDGDADLGADCYALWDESNLYLAFHVTDNVHFQTSTSFAEAWRQDSIQLTLDMGNQKRGPYDNDDFEIILEQGPDGPQVGFVVAPLYGSSMFRDAELKVSPVPDGLLYECRIPWNRLGLHDPVTGRTVGFSFLINDDDNDGQGRNWTEWTSGIGMSKNTGAYGSLRLLH